MHYISSRIYCMNNRIWMASDKRQRSHAFDFLCGICIIRMIMLHILECTQLDKSQLWEYAMHWSFYFMCFFFFKAGFFNRSVRGNSIKYCNDRFKRLMIPYFVWGWIGVIVYFTFCLFVLPPNNTMVKDLHWEHLWQTSAFYGNNPVWFLFSFFTTYICVHYIEKMKHLHWTVCVFPYISWYLSSIDNPLWLNLNNVFFGIFVFYLGKFWHKVLVSVNKCTFILISILMVGFFCYLNTTNDVYYQMSSNMWQGNFYIITLCIVAALCGISGLLLSICKVRIPIINYIGEHSMVFFVSHFVIITFYKMLKSSYVRTLKGHEDDLIILTILVFVSCFFIVPYVENVPWLSGRFKNKHN